MGRLVRWDDDLMPILTIQQIIDQESRERQTKLLPRELLSMIQFHNWQREDEVVAASKTDSRLLDWIVAQGRKWRGEVGALLDLHKRLNVNDDDLSILFFRPALEREKAAASAPQPKKR